MWGTAMGINTCIWSALAVFLVYSTGVMLIEGNVHQFLLALLLWTLSNFSEIVFAILA
jgi:hypothetical protein